MQFLYPNLLFALSLIAIPIAIHLFNLVKPQRILFSNLKFLKEVQLNNSRRLKLKHFLILLSRIFFIIFLVLAFAQPYYLIHDTTVKNTNHKVSIYLDNSLSMSAENNNQNILSVAITELKKIINSFPKNTDFQLIDNNLKANSSVFHKREKVLDMLTEIDFSNQFVSPENIYEKQISMLNKENDETTKHIIWISDFQESTFENIKNLNFDTLINHYLLNVENDLDYNVSVDSIFFESPFIRKSEANKMKAVLTNKGKEKAEKLTLKLVLNKNEVATKTIDLEANSTQISEITFDIPDTGQLAGLIEIDDNSLIFDNTFYFTLFAEPKIKIVSFTDSSINSLSKIYSNESIFEFQNFNTSNIDFGALENADLIILNELKNPDLALVDALKKHSEIGANIAIIPPHNINFERYNALFSSLNIYALKNANQALTELKKIPEGLNFFEGVFEKIDPKAIMPKIHPTLIFKNYKDAALYDVNGNAALVTYSSKNSNAYCLSFPVNYGAEAFIKQSLIVPIFYRMAMLSSKQNRTPYQLIDGKYFSIKLNAQNNSEEIFKLSHSSVELIPEQSFRNNQLKLRIAGENQMDAGIYDLKNKQEKIIQKIAFNIKSGEGNLTPIDVTELKGKHINTGGIKDSDTQSHIYNMNFGVALWKYCVILALLFLLIEILLIRFLK